METNKVVVLVVLVGIVAFSASYFMFGGEEANSEDSIGDGVGNGGGVAPSNAPPTNNSDGSNNTSEGADIGDIFGNSDDVEPPELPGL